MHVLDFADRRCRIGERRRWFGEHLDDEHVPLDRSEQRCVDDHFIELVGYGQRVGLLSLRTQSRSSANRYAHDRGSHIHGTTGNDSRFDTVSVPMRAMSIAVRQANNVRRREEAQRRQSTRGKMHPTCEKSLSYSGSHVLGSNAERMQQTRWNASCSQPRCRCRGLQWSCLLTSVSEVAGY